MAVTSKATVFGSGNDTATGSSGSDSIVALGTGLDVEIFGGAEGVPNDTDDLGDTIGALGDGDALIYGNGGNDTIIADGADSGSLYVEIYGGEGNDSIVVGNGAGFLTGLDSPAYNDGETEDALIYGGQGSDSIYLADVESSVTVYGGTGANDSADGADNIAIDVDGAGGGSALVYGNGGNDTINVESDGSTTVYGGGGNDSMAVRAEDGDAVVQGNAGADTIDVFASGGGATVFGGSEVNDSTDGADDIDVFVSGGGSALVYGNGNDDVIDVDVIDAEGVIKPGTASAAAELSSGSAEVYGGYGDDSIDVFVSGGGDAFVQGNQDADDIDVFVSGGGSATVYGGSEANDPQDGADRIDVGVSGGGSALVYGNGGDDTINVFVIGEGGEVGSRADVYGGMGADTIEVYAGNDANAQVYAGQGQDDIAVLVSGGGSATIYGGTGMNDAGDENDDISVNISGGGSALVYGNGGDDDIYVEVEGDGASATVYGGMGNDEIDVDVESPGGEGLVVGGQGNDEIDVYVDEGRATIFGGTGGDDQTDEADWIEVTVEEGDAWVYGNGGNDIIVARATQRGSVTVDGGAGDDIVVWAEGPGGRLTGGEGKDYFFFSDTGGEFDPSFDGAFNPDRIVTVTDFVSGQDKIGIEDIVADSPPQLVGEIDVSEAATIETALNIAFAALAGASGQLAGANDAGWFFFDGDAYIVGEGDNDGIFEFNVDKVIRLEDVTSLSVNDLLLVSDPFLTDDTGGDPIGPFFISVDGENGGRAWIDVDEDGTLDAGETLLTLIDSDALLGITTYKLGGIDFSVDEVTIRFWQLDGPDIDLRGFSADDKIVIDLDNMVDAYGAIGGLQSFTGYLPVSTFANATVRNLLGAAAGDTRTTFVVDYGVVTGGRGIYMYNSSSNTNIIAMFGATTGDVGTFISPSQILITWPL